MKQIIAMGGGGFAIEPDNPLMDRYILKQARAIKPKICYLPTASGDSQENIQQFYSAFHQHDCTSSHLALFKLPTCDLEDFILAQDIIYVGGGNTRNLLVLWKEWKLDVYLRRAWENDTVLTGSSAGANCWFEHAATVPFPGQIKLIQGLGLLPGGFCPHYDDEPVRRPGYHRLVSEGLITDSKAASNGAALHYRNQELYRVVSSRPEVRAYDVKLMNGKVVETVITPQYLGEFDGGEG